MDHRTADERESAPSGGASAPAGVAVWPAATGADARRRAEELAGACGLPLILDPAGTDCSILLTVAEDRLELRFPQRGGPSPLAVDFVEGPLGYARRVNRFGLLYSAIGFSHGRPSVLDATAGLGRDAFRLAWHGCRVLAVERSPVLFALLADGLRRAQADAEVRARLDGRLQLVCGDARAVLASLSAAAAPDVVYLDPMYPPKKKSALVRIEMRVLRTLVGDDPDAGALFEAAQAVARQRVVVKRHRHAEPLAGKPAHAHEDKTTRYDVYLTGRTPQPRATE